MRRSQNIRDNALKAFFRPLTAKTYPAVVEEVLRLEEAELAAKQEKPTETTPLMHSLLELIKLMAGSQRIKLSPEKIARLADLVQRYEALRKAV